jgi:hypothetical protein
VNDPHRAGLEKEEEEEVHHHHCGEHPNQAKLLEPAVHYDVKKDV